jgi:UDP-N-acetylmuramoyl-tripeptide--D-alanyl-D-alanine ligase
MLTEKAKAHGAKVLTFGMSEKANVRGSNLTLQFETRLREQRKERLPVGMNLNISVAGVTAPVLVLGVIGAHPLMSVIAATAVGTALGLSMQDAVEGLQSYEPPKGRMRLIPGIKDTLIIDDTYNASPAAVEAALAALSLVGPKIPKGPGRAAPSGGITPGRLIAVLGDMLELGKYSVEEHKKIGADAAKHCDVLVTIGLRARVIAEEALSNGMTDAQVFQYEDALKAGEELQAFVEPGDCVLVKGSQSIRTERVVERLMNEPERAHELLVRQEKDWKRR